MPINEWNEDVAQRELILTRVIDAPRARVFAVWSQAEHLTQWFCPPGFRCETHEIDVRVGGIWRFSYLSADGVHYGNRVVFLRIESPGLIEFDHGSDIDNDPGRFRVRVTFEEQSNGKTVVMMRQLHPTRAQRDAGLEFGAVEIGYGTLRHLEDYLAQGKGA